MIAALRRMLSSLTSKQRIAAAGIGVIVIAGVVVGVVASSGTPKKVVLPPAVTTSTLAPPTTTTTTTIPQLTVAPGHCPLTDLKAPGGVPDRPALAIKIGNEPDGARPQSGLNEADIVFDTPAEGFIMRYIAVYQCQNAAQIGPDRSVRWVDWHLIRQFRNPILAYAGGIGYDLNIVASLKWANSQDLLGNASSAGVRTTNRVPPDNLYTGTAALYALAGSFNKKYGPPPPIFRYSASPAAGSTPAAAMHINFSYDTDVIWTWDAAGQTWVHGYSDGPDIDALTGSPVTATNVVVMIVKYKFGNYAEHIGGSGDFESQTLGSGPGYIFRDGRAIKVAWSRRFVTQPWTFTGPNHEVVSLAPGRTWVELLPDTTAGAPGAFSITQ
jgi:Protein of unknown function (DUF3048) N-terminal domain/Protein of unknown function (DUF3048) C-terminal domain